MFLMVEQLRQSFFYRYQLDDTTRKKNRLELLLTHQLVPDHVTLCLLNDFWWDDTQILNSFFVSLLTSILKVWTWEFESHDNSSRRHSMIVGNFSKIFSSSNFRFSFENVSNDWNSFNMHTFRAHLRVARKLKIQRKSLDECDSLANI